MPVTRIAIQHDSGIDLGSASSPLSGDQLTRLLATLLRAPSEKGVSGLSIERQTSSSLGRACSFLSFVSTSGTIGGEINGNSFTFASTGVDATDATTFVTAVNASTADGVVNAVKVTQLQGSLTLSSAVAGNSFILGGLQFTAVAAGSVVGNGQFAIAASDTLTAVNIAAAINANPKLPFTVLATSSGAVVRIFSLDGTSPKLTSLASTITASAFALSKWVLLYAIDGGALGNSVTLTVTGTGVTATGTVNARMTGGVPYTQLITTTF